MPLRWMCQRVSRPLSLSRVSISSAVLFARAGSGVTPSATICAAESRGGSASRDRRTIVSGGIARKGLLASCVSRPASCGQRDAQPQRDPGPRSGFDFHGGHHRRATVPRQVGVSVVPSRHASAGNAGCESRRKPSRSRFIEVRGAGSICARGEEERAAAVVAVDGMDVSAFQFLVDAFFRRMAWVAPDWRGFGKSGHAGEMPTVPDHLADLDRYRRYRCRPRRRCDCWHSMGGNVACMYAGVCPARVSSVVPLTASSLTASPPAPGRFESGSRSWRTGKSFRRYSNLEEFSSCACKETTRPIEGGRRFFWRSIFGEVMTDGTVGHARILKTGGQPGALSTGRDPRLLAQGQCAALVAGAARPLRRDGWGAMTIIGRAKACFRDFREIVIADSGQQPSSS